MFDTYGFVIGFIIAGFLSNISDYYILYYSQINENKNHPKAKMQFIPCYAAFYVFQDKKILIKFWRYLAIEMLAAFYTSYCIARFGISWQAGAALLFGYIILISSVVDLFTQYLPDLLTYTLLVCGIIQALGGVFTDIESSLLGVVIGYGILWGVSTAFRLIRHKEGMGAGDFKLLAALGAWVGVKHLMVMLLVAPLISIVAAIIAALFFQKNIREPMPFGPALAMAGTLSLLLGDELLNYYFSLYQLVI